MNSALALILTFISAVLAICFRGIYAAVGRVGHYEVKKKAQLRRPGARTLYLLHQRGFEVLVGLTIWQMLATACFIIFLIQLIPAWASVIVATLVLTLGGEIIGSFYLQNFIKAKLDTLWPVLSKMLAVVQPFSVPIGKMLNKRFKTELPNIYSREHLLAILEKNQDSKISDLGSDEATLVESVLDFGSKQVRKVMKPIDIFPLIDRDTSIGPIVLDELFASGEAWFPVRENGQQHIIGAVSLPKLRTMRAGGKASSVLIENLPYISEESLLAEALDIYQTSHDTVFLVTNRFDDVVGILTLEQVLQELLGIKPSTDTETVVE